MASLGRVMQKAGLLLPPLAIILQLLPAGGNKPLLSLGQMLVMLVAGVCLFWIGRIVEGYARG